MTPTIPAEQNGLWFKLYKAVEAELAVVEAHKKYLLYRDMAALSFLFVIVAPVAFYLNGFGFFGVWAAASVFAVQYLSLQSLPDIAEFDLLPMFWRFTRRRQWPLLQNRSRARSEMSKADNSTRALTVHRYHLTVAARRRVL